MKTNDRKKAGGKNALTRDDRLKAALKANLARRKAQSRAKAQSEREGNGAPAKE